jgi:hypothetical protein
VTVEAPAFRPAKKVNLKRRAWAFRPAKAAKVERGFSREASVF